MADNEGIIRSKIDKMTQSQNHMIDKINTISSLMGEHSVAINKLIRQAECSIQQGTSSYQSVVALLAGIPAEFMASYHAIMAGTVVPDFFSIKSMMNVLLLRCRRIIL